MSIKEINSKESFDNLVHQGLVVTDFWATWCTPCKIQSPILEKVASEQSEITFAKVDVDKNKDLASHFGVMAIPTLLVTKDGQVVNRLIGVHNKKQIEDSLRAFA